jgi:hypothetical protein
LWGLTENDRGRRGWLVWWLPLFVIWLNLHAGFLVGVGLCLCYFVEQLVRRKPALHLLAAGLVMFGLIAANPYGLDYYSYLWRAVRMDRPDIGEWAPLYTGPQAKILLPFFLVSVGLVLVAVRERGWRELPGLLLLAASGYMAFSHVRHISLYALVWWCFVPAYLRGTSLETGLLRPVPAVRHVEDVAPDDRRPDLVPVRPRVVVGRLRYLQRAALVQRDVTGEQPVEQRSGLVVPVRDETVYRHRGVHDDFAHGALLCFRVPSA